MTGCPSGLCSVAWYDYFAAPFDGAGAVSGNPGGAFKAIKGAISPSQGSTQPLTDAAAYARNLGGQFGRLGTAFGKQYLPGSDAALSNNADAQNANIAMLQKYATGQAPSAAELMLRQTGATNGANAYATAAALGARTPGASLNAALRASQTANSTADQQAAVARAGEQASATSALNSALGQQQQGQLAQRGQTLGYMQDIYGDALGASGQNVAAAGGLVNANTQNAANSNAYWGGLVSGAASGGASLAKVASDEREKTNVQPANSSAFDKLADALKGFSFDYKHPGEVPGEAPGPRVGVMAQDAQKGGPMGMAMVSKGSDGVLRLDTGNALGAALAMSAEALRRSRKGGGSLDAAFRQAA